MHLAEFVEKTLTDIIKGISDAQRALKVEGESVRLQSYQVTRGRINPVMQSHGEGKGLRFVAANSGNEVEFIDFDIAVTAEEKTGGTGSVQVFGLGAKGEIDARAEWVSRVKFRVPIELPRAGKAE